MARTGEFGRQPRALPSITNIIVSIAREEQRLHDQNVMDAWRNGGKVDNHNATDEWVLAYWRKRLKGISKDDPLHDSYANQVLQLEYGIAQSKADLRHVQGKMSDRDFAQFYIKWARKVPKDSEFWRTLQKDAAQLMEQAKASAAADSERSKTEAYNSFVTDTQKGWTSTGDALQAALNQLASDMNMKLGGNGDYLIDLLNRKYHDDPNLYPAITAAARDSNPGWDGNITKGFVTQSVDRAEKGWGRIARRSNKDGYQSNASTANSHKASAAAFGNGVDAWPVNEAYDRALADLVAVYEDSHSSIIDRSTASGKFAGICDSLGKDSRATPEIADMLGADAARARGQDVGDLPGLGTGLLGHGGLTDEISAAIAKDSEQIAILRGSSAGAYVYASVDGEGAFDPTGNGHIGIIESTQLPPGTVSVALPTASGNALTVSVATQPIYALDPNNPNDKSGQYIGDRVQFWHGGRLVKGYKYKDGDGVDQFSLTSPASSGVTETQDGGRVVWTQAGSDGGSRDFVEAFDKEHGTSLGSKLGTPSATGGSASEYVTKGETTTKYTGTVDPDGYFHITETEMIRDAESKQLIEGNTVHIAPMAGTPQSIYGSYIDHSRASAGFIPGVTYSSWIQLSVAASRDTLNTDQMRSLSRSEAFQGAFLDQTSRGLGVDPTDPAVADQWSRTMGLALPRGGSRQADLNQDVFERHVWAGANKPGLAYPDSTVDIGNEGSLNITTGASSIKIPKVPNYLNGVNVTGQQGAPYVRPGALPQQGPSVTGQPLGGITPTPAPATTRPPAINLPSGPTTPPNLPPPDLGGNPHYDRPPGHGPLE